MVTEAAAGACFCRRPLVATGSAVVRSPSSATVSGLVGALGAPTTYWFEYGTTPSYGLRTATRTIAGGITTNPVSGSLTSLAAGTTYRYRLVAQNTAGVTLGAEARFTTPTSGGTAAPPPPASPAPPSALPPPRGASTRPGPIGAQFHCGWGKPFYTDTERQAVVDKLAAAGISWVRIDVAWSGIEDRGKGARNAGYLQTIDRCVEVSRRRGLKVLVTFWYTPGWANRNAGPMAPPTRASDYGDIARWVAARYRGRVQAWEVWNEPNSVAFWTGTTSQYVSVLRAGYRGFKAGDAKALVVLGGPSFNDDAWVRDVYARGAKDHFDVLSTHPYQGVGDEPPEASDDGTKWRFTHTPAVRKVMTDYGDADAQIWFTEFGWSAHQNALIPPEHRWARGVSEAVQADYALRAIEHARRHWPYVGAMFWYKERAWGLGTMSPAWFDVHTQGYGLLRADRSERPVYSALKRWITGR